MQNSEAFWHRSRLNRLAVAIWFALLVALFATAASPERREVLLLRGDFPGFYGPAIMVERGQIERMYDLELQRQVQNEFWPSFEGAFYIFAYPPFVAILSLPLAWLGPGSAKVVSSLLLFGLSCLAINVLIRLRNPRPKSPFLFYTSALFFPPLFISIVAAQNSAISMFLYAAATMFLLKNTKLHDFWAGICLGFWLFKPQYGLLALVIVLFSARFTILLGAGLPALFYYTVGVSQLGWSWPTNWLAVATSFGQVNFTTNLAQFASLTATSQALLSMDTPTWFVGLIGICVSCALLVFLCWSFYKTGCGRENLSLLGPTLILVAPQSLFYDIGFCVVSLALTVVAKTDRQISLLLLAYGGVIALGLMRGALLFPVYLLLAVAIYLYLLMNSKNRCLKTN